MKTGLITIALIATLYALPAVAHGPDGHPQPAAVPTALPSPTTCAELDDRDKYSNDVTKPEIAALKKRCDEEKKSSTESTEKPLQPEPAKDE